MKISSLCRQYRSEHLLSMKEENKLTGYASHLVRNLGEADNANFQAARYLFSTSTHSRVVL